MSLSRDLIDLPPHANFGKLKSHQLFRHAGKNYHDFIFVKEFNENYVVVVIDAQEEYSLGTERTPPRLKKTKDLFNIPCIGKSGASMKYEKRLSILDSILKTVGHKGYQVFTALDGYSKHIELENQRASSDGQIYAIFSETEISDYQFQIKPYGSIELLQQQFEKRLTFIIKELRDKALSSSELDEKEIGALLIEKIKAEIKADAERGVQYPSNHGKFEKLKDDETNMSLQFLAWLEERKTTLKAKKTNTPNFGQYLNTKGQQLLPFLAQNYLGVKVQEIAMMLLALEKMNLLSQGICPFGHDELARVLEDTFKPRMRAEKLSRQALNISKYKAEIGTYTPKIDKQVDFIEAELRRLTSN